MFQNSTIVAEFADITHVMWSMGWDEKNGGNISAILTEEQLTQVNQVASPPFVPLEHVPENMVGRHVLITASGSEFRRVRDSLTETLGVIRVEPNGYAIVWGFEGDNKPTSEIYMHLLSHSTRLAVDPHHRIVLHNHATEVSALSFILDQTDQAFTQTLWRMITECLIVFPDGIGVVPWMVCGTEAIGQATAAKLKDSRIVVWAYHGILATGSSIADCFGLIETVNKAAKVYLSIAHLPHQDGISDGQLHDLADFFKVTPRWELLEQ